MRISVLCSNRAHPVFAYLEQWIRRRQSAHEVELVNLAQQLHGGDLLFLISCMEIIKAPVRSRYRHTLVVHASALPEGRGWSPHVWQILGGRSRITVTLLEADDGVDTGDIWAQRDISLEGHELYDEINAKLFGATLELMDFALDNSAAIEPRSQVGTPTYYRKRTPQDSRLDPDKTIAEQFDLLRVADPERFPCFVELRGKRYRVILRKEDSA